MSEAGMSQIMYCAVADVVDRTLTKTADVSNYTPSMQYAIVEASRTVDIFLQVYEPNDLPFNGTLPNGNPANNGHKNVPDPVVIFTADLAVSVWKRRLNPAEASVRGPLQPDFINDIDGSGWFAVFLKKLLEYIKNYYALPIAPDSRTSPTGTGYLVNPDYFRTLFMRGIITLKEARAYMSNPNLAIQEILSKQSLTIEKQQSFKSLIEQRYPTKLQRAMAFVRGRWNQNKGGYKVDSNQEPNPQESDSNEAEGEVAEGS